MSTYFSQTKTRVGVDVTYCVAAMQFFSGEFGRVLTGYLASCTHTHTQSRESHGRLVRYVTHSRSIPSLLPKSAAGLRGFGLFQYLSKPKTTFRTDERRSAQYVSRLNMDMASFQAFLNHLSSYSTKFSTCFASCSYLS